MDPFTPDDLAAIDRLWRSLPQDHVWTGWAAAGEAPTEVWIIRTRANWRRFPLRKHAGGFALHDETGDIIAMDTALAGLLARVEALPALGTLAVDAQARDGQAAAADGGQLPSG